MRLDLPDTLAILDRLLESEPQTSKPGGFAVRLRRLRELLAETQTAEPTLAAIAGFVFPGVSRNSLRTTLLEFRKSLTEAAAAVGLDITLIRPDARGVDADQVVCHFEGKPIPLVFDTSGEGAVLSRENEVIEPRARATKIFISFAVADQKWSKEFTDQLKANLPLRFAEPVQLWRFDEKGGILPGEDNEEIIRQRMNESQFGILLVTPTYLERPFIKRVELPHFLGENAKAHPIPVALADFVPGQDKHELLNAKNVFTHQGKSFYQTDAKDRGAFIKALCDRIAETITKYPAPPASRSSTEIQHAGEAFAHLCPELREEDGNYVPNHGRMERSLGKSATKADEDRNEASVPVLETLQSWIDDPTDSAYMAILGEAGAGKTMTCSKLAHTLNARKPGSCIYIDLRLLNESGLLKTQPNPTLHQILDAILSRNTHHGKITPERVLQAVREQGALLIWDGLDEVLVHLSTDEGDAMFRQLKDALPPQTIARPGKTPGRLIIACRTHWFRSYEHEASTLTHSQRGPVRADAPETRRARFRVLRLLPFDDDQIRAYLVANVPGLDLERALDVIHRVHNLHDLAQRPYCLSLMRTSLPDLDRTLAAGKKVRSVDLYRSLVRSWLARDNTKHRFDEDDKPRLMASLAAWMWREGAKTLTSERLGQWLKETIIADPTFRAMYGDSFKETKKRDELLQDFRTATFIARWDGDSFRFAHTSLQEYFLACHLVHALETGDLDAWNLPRVNRETLDFAAELFLKRSEEGSALKARLENTLTQLLQQNLPGHSENALAFYLSLSANGETNLSIPNANLCELDLTAWEICGTPDRPLQLMAADFSGAKLIRARFHHVALNDSKWNGADLCSAEFVECALETADFSSGDQATCMEGVRIRDCRLKGSQITGVDAKGLRVDLPVWDKETEEIWSNVYLTDHHTPSAMPTPNAQWAFGHRNSVMKVVCFPCGRFIASGSLDGAVRIWDVTNGECLLNLEGHSGGIEDLAISPDGKLLASAGRDDRVIIWDVRPGKQMHHLKGFGGSARSVFFTGDGTGLFVGASDECLRLYGIDAGDCIFNLTSDEPGSSFLGTVVHVNWTENRVYCSRHIREFIAIGLDGETTQFRGHDKQIRSIATSPRDPIVASSGDDNLVRLWNKETGECIRVFDHHTKPVNVVAFSADGTRLLSGSDDGSIHVWDCRSWTEISTIQAADSVKSAAFSPDGKRIVLGTRLSIQIWDLARQDFVREISGSHNATSCIAYSWSGSRFASGTWYGSVSVWDGLVGKRIQRMDKPARQISCVMFLPGDLELAMASTSGEFIVVDASEGTIKFATQGHTGPVYAFASDLLGSRIASASTDKTVKLWDVANGSCVLELEQVDMIIHYLAISPNDKWIVGGGNNQHGVKNQVCIWEVSSGRLRILDKSHRNSVNAIAISPDSRFLVSSSIYDSIYRWDLESGLLLGMINEGTREIANLSFSADGKRILAFSKGHPLRAWDFESGVPRQIEPEDVAHFQKGMLSCGFNLALSPFGTMRPLASDARELDIFEDKNGNYAVLERNGDDDHWRLARAKGEYWRYVNYATDGPEGRVLWSADVLGPVPEA